MGMMPPQKWAPFAETLLTPAQLDAVLRHLTVKMDRAVTEPSPMMKEEKAKNLLDTAAQEGAAEAPAAAE